MQENFQILEKRKNEKGAALMMALFFFTIASFIVTQLSTETLTESVLASREMRKLKSKYSAKAGLEMALLRIKAFQHAKAAVSKAAGNQNVNFDQQLAMIWQFPLPWPIELGEDAGLISKDDNEKVLKKSLISNITFFHDIQDAGQRLDLNSLGSPVERISEKTLESLLRTFEQLLTTDSALSKEHSIDSITEILNNVADWIDRDEESRNGGDESGYYSFAEQRGYPRNSSLMTMSELMLVDKMDDLIFNHLKKIGTIHGTFGINVNTAEKDALMSIDSQFTEQVTADFLERRTEIQAQGGNLDEASFDNLLSELGFSDVADIHANGIPILYSPLSTFLVTSSGTTGNITTTITASVMDANVLKEIFIEQLDKGAALDDANNESTPSTSDPNGPNQGTQEQTTKKDSPPPKGRPLIIQLSVD
ncbi:MAG: general secretion pathway protein GspK [Bdellovibrionales bacterium]